jgi:reverse gyrase
VLENLNFISRVGSLEEMADLGKENIPAIFIKMCPNCGGDITSDRLSRWLPCVSCLPEVPENITFEEIKNELERLGRLKSLGEIYEIEKRADEFSKFFEKIVGFPPWSLQVGWAKRVLTGQSFVALAPTGVGKTTFGIVTALFLEGKSYIVIPTKLLSKLVAKRVIEAAEKLGINKKILIVHGAKNIKEKEALQNSDFDILITTSMFLARNEKLILDKRFDFIFIDDVDTYLKQPKNVERILKVMGLSDEDVNELKTLMNRKFSIVRGKESIEEKIKGFNEISEKVSEIRKKIKGVLVISSATAKPRANTTRYFREIFGFEISPYATTIRNIEDTIIDYNGENNGKEKLTNIKAYVFEKTREVIQKCGNGCFIFINAEYGKQSVYEMKDFLKSSGIEVATYEEFDDKTQEKFRNGEIKAVIGISSLRNPLCRGIDMPDAVRYAVFAGVPRFIFSLGEIDEPAKMLGVLISLKNAIGNGKKIFSFIESMKKYSGMRAEDIEKYPPIKERILSIKNFIEEKLNDPEVIKKIKESEDIPLRIGEDGKIKFVVADSSAYIQASGRTSRLYIGGLSKGLSVMIVDDKKAFVQLKKRLKLELFESINFKEFDKIELKNVLEEIDNDRKNIRDLMEGKITPLITQASIKPPQNALVIVESPNKAGTIAKLIGKPTKRRILVNGNGKTQDAWEVSRGDLNITIIASGGHIIDLPYSYYREENEKDEKYDVKIVKQNGKITFIPKYKSIKRCRNCGENFFEDEKCPYCGSINFDDKTEVIKAIQKLAQEANLIFIATDPDYEGEKIAFDLFMSIPKYKKEIKRIEYHEVTRKAIFNAIQNPRDLNLSLVMSQIVRRVTDRWVGFAMSEFLQKEEEKRWLSAGRVQTPVLGWLIEREKEMKNKIGVLSFKGENGISDSIRIENREQAKRISKSIKKLKGRKRKNEEDEKQRLENAKIKIRYELLDTSEDTMNPPPPLNTPELIKEAFSKLKLSSTQTMSLAQQLFELGMITYHRTDSTHVSDVGISLAKEFITENIGANYFVGRTWGEEGAHECIRPTKALTPDELSISSKIGTISLSENAIKLYEIIFSRFIASQMKPIKVLKGKVKLQISWNANGEEISIEKISEMNLKVIEDGWNKVNFLPISDVGRFIVEKKVIEFETKDFKFSFVPPVPPYTHGSLIEEMRKRGIGRPSTYAYIIKTLLDRGYCIDRKGFIIITKLGKEVYEKLRNSKKYSKYTNEEYTRKVEEKMDKIGKGEENYMEVLKELYLELFQNDPTYN